MKFDSDLSNRLLLLIPFAVYDLDEYLLIHDHIETKKWTFVSLGCFRINRDSRS